jgi:hypothetical protein
MIRKELFYYLSFAYSFFVRMVNSLIIVSINSLISLILLTLKLTVFTAWTRLTLSK